MKVLNVLNGELVEVMWIDDNEIEYIPINEFKLKYPHIKISLVTQEIVRSFTAHD